MTPAQAHAQAYGENFITDVPVQGPTDEGIRAADCWWAQNRLPKDPACVDCKGPIPMWARTTGLSERISFGGAGRRGFALAAAGDPSVWETLTPNQQVWVRDSLVKLNTLIVTTTKTTCPTFGPSITAAGGCFQQWFNSNTKGAYTKADGSKLVLRTDGVFDQDTLDALITIAGMYGKEHFQAFPVVASVDEEEKLSTAAMWGIGLLAAAGVGGAVYLVTRKRRR